MKLLRKLLWLALAAAVAAPLLSWLWPDRPASAPKAPPNILLIMADDLGYNDIGYFGDGTAQTPHIDAIARDGVRFRRHYANATCRPSRMALLTGMPSSRVGVPPHIRGLTPELTTLPEALAGGGYQTRHIGKWHLGHWLESSRPEHQGFDDWYGFLSSLQTKNKPSDPPGVSYINPWLQGKDLSPTQQQGHLTDLLTDAAVSEIRELAATDKPWFINLWYFAPHTPIEPSAQFSQRFPATPEGQYLALVAQLDHSVGRLMAALEETGARNNTLVVFLSDNGGTNRYRNSNKPFFGKKNTFREGGLRTPFILNLPGRIEAADIDEPVLISDVMPTLLALVQARVPEEVRGRNVLPLLAGTQLPAQPRYFWDFGIPGFAKYGVLDLLDGSLTYAGKQQHWDSEQGQFGRPAEPAAQALINADTRYREWAQAIRVAELEVTTLADGSTLLGGDSYRRTPGFGAWTLQLPVRIGPGRNTHIAQPRQFSLDINGSDIQVELPGHRFTARAPGPGCQLLTLSTYYRWSERQPASSKGLVSLALNDRRLYEDQFRVHAGILVDRYEPIASAAGQALPLISNEKLQENLVKHYEEVAGAVSCEQ